MGNIEYTVNVTGGDIQAFKITGGGTGQPVSESDTDTAVRAFASSLASVPGLVVNSTQKTVTTTSVDTTYL